MEKKLWFKRKSYGWGWTPVSWEGWVIICIYAFMMAFAFSYFDVRSHSGSDTFINFATPCIFFTSILILICYKKGETPKWQWGEKSDQK